MTAPLDPDAASARPLHLRPGAIAIVAAGGTVGTAAREGLSLALPVVGGFPVNVLVINLLGAFALGVLLEALLRSGPDTGRRRMLRLLLGTGFCGGFTTYSALANAAALLLIAGQAGTAIAYGLVTVLVGGAATWAGVLVGAAGTRRSA